MNCPTEGMLRAHLDHELAAAESAEIERHLSVCPTCREQSAAIGAQAQQVNGVLAVEGGTVDPDLAYSRYRRQFGERVGHRAVWKRPVWAALAAGCAFAALLSFAPARGWGQKILDMLRVQKVAVVTVDLPMHDEHNGMRQPGRALARLISDSVVVTMKPGEPTVEPTVNAASGMAGFGIRTLDELGAPAKILVNAEMAFHMTLNRDRMQAVLDAAGRSDIQVPADADGSTVAVHIPKMVRLLYGSCPAGNCMTFMQVPSPIISVPPGLNLGEIAEAGLQVAGMSAAEAHAFSQTVDWSSTLVIPIPQRGSSSRTIPVDGVTGTLVELAAQGSFPGRYTLIWVKNGIVCSLEGRGDPNQAIAAAGSLN